MNRLPRELYVEQRSFEQFSQHKRLVTSWSESKYTRQQYWDRKKKKEKRDAQLDDHIDRIRTDALKQTQDVANSVTRDVGQRLQGKRTALQSTVTCPLSSSMSSPEQVPAPSLILQPPTVSLASTHAPLPAFSKAGSTASSEGDSSNDEEDLHRFRESFKAMDNRYKWKLPSGQYAENILYKAGRQIQSQWYSVLFSVDYNE
ncbi:hypothetical protein BGZ49_004258 [Haplosporangium sp. Z 27]|nr:hypothetical protein BGZ49_004258 [Haplosporangium sp. Z 27]